MQRNSSGWIRRSGRDAPARLICFPYAGGSCSAFGGLQQHLPSIEICGVQLPGRQDRLAEPPLDDLVPLVEALLIAMRPLLDKPFALFGYSSGAILAFELAHALRDVAGPAMRHLFVAAAGAPQLGLDHPRIAELPVPQFLAELIALGGLPPELGSDPHLADLVLPMLRADVRWHENYVFRQRPSLTIPITALGGHDDRFVDVARLARWRDLTAGPFGLDLLPGGHLFIADQHKTVAELITRRFRCIQPASNVSRNEVVNR
ncbi:thioesterase II family protein [Rhodopseudomonas palustris]|uniref:Thioesterase n=1 Tax=Rhodopseudomonas palustris (strain BisB18) TaxID=316056 RepID=Q217L7_RHOPB